MNSPCEVPHEGLYPVSRKAGAEDEQKSGLERPVVLDYRNNIRSSRISFAVEHDVWSKSADSDRPFPLPYPPD